jgi:hypothetical protein
MIFGVLSALAGCATSDHVLFVTKTSIGIDFDSKPPSASIAYDRVEGYVAPRYNNGEIPAVIASIKSDGAIFNPKIRQIYATGEAAEIVVSGAPDQNGGRRLKGEKRLMFFGTTTTTGLKVGFTTGLPDSLTFGFKRKEFSYIPLGSVGKGDAAHDVYPSILASIDTEANAGNREETSLNNAQFFATGRAARLLASNDAVRTAFRKEAAKALKSRQLARVQDFKKASAENAKLVDDIVESFDRLKNPADKDAVLKFANREIADDEMKGELFLDAESFDEDLVEFSKFSKQVDVSGLLTKLKKQIDGQLPKGKQEKRP